MTLWDKIFSDKWLKWAIITLAYFLLIVMVLHKRSEVNQIYTVLLAAACISAIIRFMFLILIRTPKIPRKHIFSEMISNNVSSISMIGYLWLFNVLISPTGEAKFVLYGLIVLLLVGILVSIIVNIIKGTKSSFSNSGNKKDVIEFTKEK